MRNDLFTRCFVCFLALSLAFPLIAQETGPYQITKITYDIEGSTREFPLSQAVTISKNKIFPTRESLDAYLDDVKLQLSNQRVLESVSLDTALGTKDEHGVTPVSLTVHTVDTWNIIALPYPKFDSNSGLQFKVKLKNYNFFGSMQELNGDLVYELDNDSKNNFSTAFDFAIPFEFHHYAMSWNNDFSAEFPQGEVPEVNVTSGLSIDVPVAFTKIVFGFDQSMVVNDRHDVEVDGDTETVLYEDDPLYFNEKFSAEIPFTLYKSLRHGDLVWAPESSISTNIASGGMHDDDLKGPELQFGHGITFGRVNWRGNFRYGMTFDVSNTYTYNLATSDNLEIAIDGCATGYTYFFDRVGLYSRVKGFYNFDEETDDDIGEPLRGILNSRIDSDTAFSLNIDMPVKILDVDFPEITGVKWTKYISFEMQASPFFDMMLTHDEKTGRYYSLDDGWYSGGFEMIVYPKKMRSIYARVSAGFDLGDMVKNGWKTRSYAERDDKSTHEYYIGIGLAY